MTDLISTAIIVINVIGAFLFIHDFIEDELLNGFRVKHIVYLTIFLPATISLSIVLGGGLLCVSLADKIPAIWNKKLFNKRS